MPSELDVLDGKVYHNGKWITRNRYMYELQQRNWATLDQVQELAMAETRTVVSVAEGFAQQEFGGFLRESIFPIVDKWGRVNATAAMDYYEESRNVWWQMHSQENQAVGRDAIRGKETRYAAARLRGQIRKANYADYKAILPTYDVIGKSEYIINAGMKAFMGQPFPDAVKTIENAMTRQVASFHRDAILFNAGLDAAVHKVQRVAEANACAFCRLMALGYKGQKARTADYAIHYHDHCRCTIEVLFEGDEPIRPDYYDLFEKQASKYGQAGWQAGSIDLQRAIRAGEEK